MRRLIVCCRWRTCASSAAHSRKTSIASSRSSRLRHVTPTDAPNTAQRTSEASATTLALTLALPGMLVCGAVAKSTGALVWAPAPLPRRVRAGNFYYTYFVLLVGQNPNTWCAA